MPITPSAEKRARQNIIRRARLLPYRTMMKTMVRKFMDAVKAGKLEEARSLLPTIYKAIDTASKKRIIHRNAAARKKSRMAKLLHK